jgi:Domain of unknown function (DUF4296)
MSVRFLLFTILIATLFSCKQEQKETAPLSRDQMVSLMMEIYLAEARTATVPVGKDSAYRLFIPRQDSLLHRMGIQDSTLRASYSYYLKHPADLEAIYDAIIDSLSLREQRLREAPSQQPGK